MKTIQLSERELSIVYSLMAPPYRAEDIRSDEFNELRNKVFYALRDAKNDEPVSNRDELSDGWIKCSERMPEQKTGVLVACEMDGPGDWRMKWASYIPEHPYAIYGWLIPGASWKPTHWMPLPAAPQQEARKSNVIGSYQGADGQEHPIVSLSSPQEVK